MTWEQQDQTVSLHSTQSASSTQTPLFRMSMEYRITHTGGDTVVRVFHGASEETYQFQVPHEVTGVLIDPYNQVLDGVAEEKKSTSEEVPIFSLSPNPNRGTFSFRLLDVAGDETVDRVAVEIFTGTGQLVYRGTYQGCVPYMEYPVNMEHPVRGLYYARFRYGYRIEMLKVLVE